MIRAEAGSAFLSWRGQKPAKNSRHGRAALRPIPFFANKNRAFWRLQAAGWGGAMLLRAASGLANSQPLSYLVLVLISTVTGLSLTLILR